MKERHLKVTAFCQLIYDKGYVINTPQVEALLKEESLVPTMNAFSEHLSHTGFDFFLMLVMDLLHEFELGVWKAVFIHLLRMLESLKGDQLAELDRRYQKVPTFGCSIICRLCKNVSKLKQMTAHRFEDLLQCAILTFEALLPDLHNNQVAKFSFLLAHWHSLAKLRLHTDETLAVFEKVNVCLGIELCTFANETCAAFSTKEL
ncbi:hypothetical protein SCLCIDRAFT_34500 [Scleroderma citrinum Foug A]|uniref:Uncharacterized protein n=1 Tax=Scleroderma citrinum Foug A TaxID=1036808 RepID=A0A0C3D1E2_9AGAM|nr:hypothetical protein SCLCIDRAFT_34500 [Scleroderma citrinum Foug A]